MDQRFEQIYTHPENEIFRVVFFPDRIYHARYLSATRSSRYRYNVTEVRSGADSTVMKGDVYLDGSRLCGMLRVEYTGQRLVEQARQFERRLGPVTRAWVRLLPDGADPAEATVALHWDPIINAYAVEIWETLDPGDNQTHDHRVLADMGRDAAITSVAGFRSALHDLPNLRQVLVAFSEDDVLYPTGQSIGNQQWDNDYRRSHQEPRDPTPSSDNNTIEDDNYSLSFQRGYFIPDASKITPVSYVNPMSDAGNPDRRDDNVVQMRWLFQRELGTDLVFFHEVTVPPGAVEGTHRHIGSEEVYYIVSGTGLVYINDGDDPNTQNYPLVTRPIYGLDPLPCRELPVQAGSVLCTKSGGVHGIRNPGTEPLKFVAFLYQTS
jgi:mannose-6-phosphate isomerase-like protein (cupin superfamily)